MGGSIRVIHDSRLLILFILRKMAEMYVDVGDYNLSSFPNPIQIEVVANSQNKTSVIASFFNWLTTPRPNSHYMPLKENTGNGALMPPKEDTYYMNANLSNTNDEALGEIKTLVKFRLYDYLSNPSGE
jgi:hypothetical protein